jgi:hypothetical protein
MTNISFFKALLMKELNEKDLPGNQENIAQAAEPKDKITGADFKALRAKKGMKKEDFKLEEKVDMEELEMMLKKLKKDNPGKKVTYSFIKDSPKGYVFYIDKKLVKEGEDHEVSMAQNSLKSIISSASQLMNLLGQDEKDVPAWIQDHITNAENFINQASKNYHEYNEGSTSEYDIDELPDGTEEVPAGDAEDLDMKLQGLMENLKKSKLKEFGPSIANVSKARFKLEDVINWFTKKQQAKELKHGFKRQFKDFINRLKSHAESENGYIPVNYVYHDINDYVAYWPTEWSREEYAVQEKLQNKHAKELYSAIRSELKMYDRKVNSIN